MSNEKREQEMMEAAEAYAESVGYKDENDLCATLNVFCAGWRAADQHPRWISVEEDFPPFDWVENGSYKRSMPVLICDPIRGIFVGCYESDDLYGNTYWLYDNGKRATREVSGGYEIDNITHWMPLPTPPQGKEE